MRTTRFAEGEYYHVFNRGVEKRDLFVDRADYERFLFHVYACNDTHPLLNAHAQYRGLASIGGRESTRVPLVDILCDCLMPNHFHLLLRQLRPRGVSLFLQKLGTAYTMYFNTKYQRVGGLFQGPYKTVHVARDQYLFPLTRYIHLNPLDLLQPRWKEHGIRDWRRARAFLAQYPWSSYPDYLMAERFPGLLNTAMLQESFRGPHDYQAYVERWTARDLHRLGPIAIEVAIEAKPR